MIIPWRDWIGEAIIENRYRAGELESADVIRVVPDPRFELADMATDCIISDLSWEDCGPTIGVSGNYAGERFEFTYIKIKCNH